MTKNYTGPGRRVGPGGLLLIRAAPRLASTEASPGEEPQTAKNHTSVTAPFSHLDVRIRFKAQVGDGERRWEADTGSLLSYQSHLDGVAPPPAITQAYLT